MSKINLNRNIPSHWAFLVMIILSFLLSWFTVSEGQKIAEDAKNSQTFNISKRIENNKLSH
ncbi:MAG: hypothetical protein US30_C0011G0038 [Candidatus Moranbacteria bacterium GW2011_GWF2_36_839]|nr:MAG: hypothetical protein US27_C0011G0006 [Candidatus Moranbacteria bacterium GW2011_GWF1_36_78]KKQ16807.1 MAG: hypothetical protein US30_C0011G0038 [Candidatus Moranbacteria bacterium GW2011_GWF2_36_839]HAT73610.1 hypothetical protein [Candidatus Moranbacteria bacterium]HBY10578.1 hypothetical protein [Candidatus Moranbacteria bacterium]